MIENKTMAELLTVWTNGGLLSMLSVMFRLRSSALSPVSNGQTSHLSQSQGLRKLSFSAMLLKGLIVLDFPNPLVAGKLRPNARVVSSLVITT